jgi:hypothetical protein
MQRRTFLKQGSIFTAGLAVRKAWPYLQVPSTDTDLYSLFKNPSSIYRPFVRWWWNGDKIEKTELARELRLLKEAGIGGVEINPIQFPARTNDMGKASVQWLSKEWIELLSFTFDEARSLDMTCDLIVGSGWPFGAEWLEGEERSQVMVIGAKKIEGPLAYEVSLFDLLKEADPAISAPYSGRIPEIISVQLVPSPMNGLEEIVDLSSQIATGTIKCFIPKGNHTLYALVKINGFMEVINGAPGASGPVLNHYNEDAVKKYLRRMSDTIQAQAGPLSGKIRALFTDSLELEGANWCKDMANEFQQRRGYDLLPWLPFILFKSGGMGNTFDYNYGVAFSAALSEKIQRIRYDFDLTKTELLQERFLASFTAWCRENKVLSRAQAYGRGYFLLEGSFTIDLPECETWIKYGIGTDMSETDYRIGRAYSMINKYVSSAAHLKGKRHISCEELTNTDMVFNETLEILKIAGDQSIISGVTHPVFHGFNYSPLEAAFPGWIRYGCYFNERNNWWPHFKLFTDYKARLSALLQQGDMYADIAVMSPTADMWSIYGAQNEPFPGLMHPAYQTLIWESMHQNGNGCDYVSEQVVKEAEAREGYLQYGSRKYHSIFLIEVESIEPSTAKKLLNFIETGGRVFCIEKIPFKSPGLKNHEQNDAVVMDIVSKMKNYPDRFISLKRPLNGFNNWYKTIQQDYKLTPYVKINQPNVFVTQVRYQTKDAEILFFVNSNSQERYTINIEPVAAITSGKQAWLWDPETGERSRLETGGSFTLDLGPADSRLIIFDKNKKGNAVKTIPVNTIPAALHWSVEGKHVDGSVKSFETDELKDLKAMPEWVSFSGELTYRTNFKVNNNSKFNYLNIGRVFGVSLLSVNGKPAGTKWYGQRIYSIGELLRDGDNIIEIKVLTTMGNYLKTLKNNPVAQYWTNEKRKDQPLQSMGMLGPVSFY